MNIRTIATLMGKEYSHLARDRMFVLISILGLVLFLTIYFIIPLDVGDETVLAVYSETDATPLYETLEEYDISYDTFSSAAALQTAVQKGRYPAGLIITADTWQKMHSGSPIDLPLLIAPAIPEEYVDILTIYLGMYFNSIAYSLQGDPLLIEAEDLTLGRDLLLNELPLKKLIIPLLVVMILITEMLALGYSLINEKENRTIKAVLVAPVRVGELLAAKVITGVSIIFLETLIILAATGSLATGATVILLTVLTGAFMLTGVAFLIASLARDVMSLISWGTLVMIILILPTLGVIFPGMYATWMQVIPTFMLAESLNQLINLGGGWSAVAGQLGIFSLLCLLFLGAGLLILRRNIQCL